MNTLHAVIASAAAPAILTDAQRWFWVAVLACAAAAAIAFFTSHFLAGIKFAFAAAAGAALNFLFGVVIGSFVLTALASFACGLVVAWYILNGRHQLEPSGALAAVNARLQQLEKSAIAAAGAAGLEIHKL